jgi:hypothetical protein
VVVRGISKMFPTKYGATVIVLNLAGKKLFLRWVLEGFERSKIAGKRNPTE